MIGIKPIAGVTPDAAVPAAGTATTGAGGFAAHLDTLIDRVNDTTAEANTAISNMIDQKGDVHDAMIALHHAETALQLSVQIRNKLVSAYQDIMRMPV